MGQAGSFEEPTCVTVLLGWGLGFRFGTWVFSCQAKLHERMFVGPSKDPIVVI